MHFLAKASIFFLVPFLVSAGLHKFYLSVTEVRYSEESRSLQMITRIFIDDFEKSLEERYGIKAHLMTEQEHKDIDSYIKKYLEDKLSVTINGKPAEIKYIGKTYDVDVVKCYMEIENVRYKRLKTIVITNRILYEIFEEQQNIVHFRLPDKAKSFVFVKGNDKGLLNF
ncbi:DUF6702 family protein [Ascidiimonas aurantiaca]|uniref:DUF6702 family protein n=1 Tax=Ascidiimonas aurantiaca TaxID=1685432 RepID=UPI0030EC4F53